MFPNDYFLFGSKRYYREENLYRVNHDSTVWRDNLPEVFPFFPNHFTDFGAGYQLLEKALNARLTKDKWRAVHTYRRAFNNQQGFEMPGDPRVDWVNMKDIGSENPRQEALVCGGAILKRRFVDQEYLYPEYIDGNRPAPSLDWLLKRPYLYFDAVAVDGSAEGIAIRRFVQGEGERVFILLLASKPIKIPLSKVTRLKRGQPIPSPYEYP